jgi:hypothetical protein
MEKMAVLISDANIRHRNLTMPKLVPSNISYVPIARLPKINRNAEDEIG